MSTGISSKTALTFAPSQPSIPILLTRQWLEDNLFTHNQISSNTKNNIKLRKQRSKLSKHLNNSNYNNTQLKNIQYESSRSDFFEALRWRKKPQQFAKYIESSYDKCRNCKLLINESYDKIFMYSLLISTGFIYYSDFGNNYINGLRQIYFILIDMTNDTQLLKDINTALKKKIFWNDAEKKLVNATIQFAIRLNQLIQIVLTFDERTNANNKHKHSDSISISNSDYSDTKEPEFDKYISSGDKLFWDMNWLPNYYNGYYFGQCTEKSHQFIIVSIKKFRKLMGSDGMPYRIIIDDLIIHTYNLSESGLYIEKHNEFMHHWYSEKDWIDFGLVDSFKIGICMVNNGRIYGMNVNLYDTIKMIKDNIAINEGGISSAMFEIEYNGKRLQDKCTLYDYQIGKGCQFRITLVTNNPFLNLVAPK